MRYFEIENAKLCLKETETLPKDIELLYQSVRKQYTIEYHATDWADDDSDAGRGYCYDNSYSFSREPAREEMVIENGALAGFYVGAVGRELQNSQILPLKQGASVSTGGSHTSRYGSGQSWVLQIEEAPAHSGYVYLVYVPHEDKNKNFLPADFSEELVEAVAHQCFIEDSRGHFNGASRFTLKLTAAATQDPDRVLAYFKEYQPVMIRK